MNKGYVLITVILLVALMSLFVTALLLFSEIELIIAKNETDYIKAFNYAESGLTYGVAEVKDFAKEHPEETFTDFLITHKETKELPQLYGEKYVKITLRFEDNFDDEFVDNPLYDTDCRIRMESEAEFPINRIAAKVKLRLRISPETEDSIMPCMENIHFYGWEEVP